MTLSTTTSRISYSGNGATTAFSFPYYFLSSSDLVVISRVTATGVETTKTLTTHYTVSGAGVTSGGTVTMLVAPAAGTTLSIYRDAAATQTVDLVENDSLPAESVEQALDKSAMLAQRVKDLVTRSVRLSDGYSDTFDPTLPALLTADCTIAINEDGDGFALGPTASDLADAEENATAAAASAAAAALSEAAAIAASVALTTKGDILTRSSSANVRKGVGSDGQTLASNSNATDGLNWSWEDEPKSIKNYSLTAAVAANALTINLKDKGGSTASSTSQVKVGMRSATAATGTYVQRYVGGALSVVVPSSATLGHVSAMDQYIWVYLVDNAGTPELAVSGVKLFSENSIVSTTAISAAATSGTVMYSTSARTNVACRLIGRMLSQQATAGTWATAIAEITLDPRPVVNMTDWESWTPTANFTSNATFTGKKRRAGSNIELQINVAFSGATDGVNYAFNMPSGISLDATNTLNTDTTNWRLPGIATYRDAGTASYCLFIQYINATTFGLMVEGTTGSFLSQASTLSNTTPATVANGDYIYIWTSFPVAGWSTYGP